MSLTVLALPVPSNNGVGAPVDTHLLDAQKTFVLDGTLGQGEVLAIEATEDPAGLIGYTGLVAWTNSNPGDITVDVVAAFMRVRRTFAQTAFAPTASVAATQLGANSYFSLPVPNLTPGTSGAGTAVDVSGGGPSVSFTPHLDTGFVPNEQLVVQGSQDGASWNGLVAFSSKVPPGFYSVSYRFLRVFRVNAGTAAMQMLAGTATATSSGGLFPGFGGAPPAIAAAGSGGSTGLVSDAGHTHEGVHSVNGAKGDVTTPSFGGVPPAIQATGLAGNTGTMSDAGHTHAGVHSVNGAEGDITIPTPLLIHGYVTASISGASACSLPGAAIGDKVELIIDPTGIDPNPPSHFETVITVVNQIQQLTGFPGATFPVPVLLGRNL